MIGTPGGYFAYGHDLDVAFSTDGRAWQSFELPPSAPGCPGDQVDAIEAAAGDGRMLVVLGAYTNAQCRLQTFAWSSADGRTWHRSQPFGEQRGFSEARAVDLWPVPGGWEAAIAAYDVAADTGHTAIWHSPDGMRWAPESVLDAHGSVDGAADADGRRVLAVTASFTRTSGPRAEQVALAWSADGMTWRQLALPAARRSLDSVVWRVLPPGAGRASWILASTQYPPDDDPRTTLWTSIDLTGWVPLALPEHALYSIDSASIGVVLTGCDGNAVECTHYIARNDATGWTEIEIPSSERYWRHIADGPAGVLMVLEDGAVYRLVE